MSFCVINTYYQSVYNHRMGLFNKKYITRNINCYLPNIELNNLQNASITSKYIWQEIVFRLASNVSAPVHAKIARLLKITPVVIFCRILALFVEVL